MKGKACAPVKTGILTFYCSDDCGAMLQAYGLKECAKSICPETEILPYAPYFMTGRHWLFPYYPSVRRESTVRWSLRSAKRNLRMGRRFFCRRRNMRKFRERYLVKGVRTIRTLRGLEKSACGIYLIGSDQIWNPEITFGLRRARHRHEAG